MQRNQEVLFECMFNDHRPCVLRLCLWNASATSCTVVQQWLHDTKSVVCVMCNPSFSGHEEPWRFSICTLHDHDMAVHLSS